MSNLEKTKCSVYWIYLPEHADMFSQGYVGITVKTVEQRFNQHLTTTKSKVKRNTINNAIAKYGERLICKTIVEADVEYCRYIENKLRPTPNIGWNINIGGDLPPMTGRKHSVEFISKMSKSNNRELSRQRMCRFVIAPNPWLARKANKFLWQNAENIYQAILENPELGYRRIQTILGIDRSVGNIMSIYNKIKQNGYIPSQDPEWVSWMKSLNKEY